MRSRRLWLRRSQSRDRLRWGRHPGPAPRPAPNTEPSSPAQPTRRAAASPPCQSTPWLHR
jgi:hypothetical protein